MVHYFSVLILKVIYWGCFESVNETEILEDLCVYLRSD